MQPSTPSDPEALTTTTPAQREITEPDFAGEPRPIGELTVEKDFPQCALGVHVDIRGFAGVVVEIVNHSIKVRSSEGITQRFNANRLKTLYAPPDRSEPPPLILERPRRASEHAPAISETPPRVFIADPDFSTPIQPIDQFASRSDFPACTFGRHIEILGYSGVVVEIVKGSLKVQSMAGVTRSYNSAVLKKLHGNPAKPF